MGLKFNIERKTSIYTGYQENCTINELKIVDFYDSFTHLYKSFEFYLHLAQLDILEFKLYPNDSLIILIVKNVIMHCTMYCTVMCSALNYSAVCILLHLTALHMYCNGLH